MDLRGFIFPCPLSCSPCPITAHRRLLGQSTHSEVALAMSSSVKVELPMGGAPAPYRPDVAKKHKKDKKHEDNKDKKEKKEKKEKPNQRNVESWLHADALCCGATLSQAVCYCSWPVKAFSLCKYGCSVCKNKQQHHNPAGQTAQEGEARPEAEGRRGRQPRQQEGQRGPVGNSVFRPVRGCAAGAAC